MSEPERLGSSCLKPSRPILPAGIRIGTAGWSIPAAARDEFAAAGSALARYASRLDAVEINSSFYRPHRASTYARWAETVPETFRFAVKLPRTITHERRLEGAQCLVADFLGPIRELGARLGPVLIQLPPSLDFDPSAAAAFLDQMRQAFDGALVCEPRHPGWFTPQAEELLTRYRVARVAADPAPVAQARLPGGWPELAYWRLHGSPHMYRSDYSPAALDALATQFRAHTARDQWCMFDNTTLGFATPNALRLAKTLESNPNP